jgi:hypothetical protein
MTQLLRPFLALLAIAVGILLVTSGGTRAIEEPLPAAGSGSYGPTEVNSVAEIPVSPCPAGGYLCADIARDAPLRVRRWTRPVGTMVVHVPAPDFEPPARAARLQSAAAAGIRAWNGHPFAVRVEARIAEEAHFAVRWVSTLGGDAVGVARTRWSPESGLEVTSIDLATRSPFAPQTPLDPERVRLTAAHEMGHALGLPHSDSSRDVMYPTNTAASLTARDYRSMEALYALPDGAELAP